MKIEDVLARRADLSTFLVHLTRGSDGESAADKLLSILSSCRIEARTPFGHAAKALAEHELESDTQKCVCFTETPLEHVSLLLEEIEDRDCKFEPYGIALAKKQGRRLGANPVWYVDITPGHDWLSKPINELVEQAIQGGDFDDHPISKLAPFIEQMGSGTRRDGAGGYKKEFWWEREWRCAGDFDLPQSFLILCPEDEILEFQRAVLENLRAINAKVIDPRWSLEQIVARLAEFDENDVGPF